jgi:hypothetical protein
LLQAKDDSEIDWKLLHDPDWNLWSPHLLQRRWLTMKKSIHKWQSMPHQSTCWPSYGLRAVF